MTSVPEGLSQGSAISNSYCLSKTFTWVSGRLSAHKQAYCASWSEFKIILILGAELISAHPLYSSKLGAPVPSHTLCMIGITFFVTHKINENPVSNLYHFYKTVKFGLALGFCLTVLMKYLTNNK